MRKPAIAALLLLLASSMLLSACKGHSKKSMKGDEEVTIDDFVSFFDELALPFAFTDTLLSAKGNDSVLIDYKVFSGFMGDTLLNKDYKKEKPKIYAIGRFRNGKAETYLLLRTKGSHNNVYIVAIDDKMKPKAGLLLLSNKGNAAETNTVSIDRRFTITLADDYKKPDGTTATYSTVYAYNTAGLFMVIMSDGLKKGEELQVINPIDTLPQKRLHSGNYGTGKKNFISIRDAENDKKMLFYLHMDKGNECVAELKGEARWTKKDEAVFDSNADGCKINFHFTGNQIVVTELGGCGSRRPGDCSFNATYTKQKAPKQKVSKK